MQNPESPQQRNWWPIVIVGAVLLVLSACGLFLVFGAGLLLARPDASQVVQPGVIEKSVPAGPSAGEQSTAEQSAAGLPELDPFTARLQDLHGLIEVQDASGAWQSVSAPIALVAGQQVRTGELSSARLVFYDDSQVMLGPNSQLALDELEVRQSDGAHRIVMTQNAGESHHQVAKSHFPDSQYVVNTPNASAEAQGTVFQVSVTPLGDSRVRVSEGLVAVTGISVSIQVQAGEVTTIAADEEPTDPVLFFYGEGLVSALGETWIIDGESYTIHPGTQISGNPQAGDWVRVEGRLLPDGQRLADWIFLLRPSPLNRFRLTGAVEAMDAAAWVVSGQSITINDVTEIEPGIQTGDQVTVEGIVQEDGLLLAETIHLADAEAMPFAFTGVIQDMAAESWTVSGVTLALNADTELDPGLAIGDLVQVQGHITADGTWLAESILRLAADERSFEFTGAIDSIDPWSVAGLSFQTREWTEIEPGLQVGDMVQVSGVILEDGSWVATRIERLVVDQVQFVLIGIVNGMDPWVVSGISLQVDEGSIIVGDIQLGMLVQVILQPLPDGGWLIVHLQPLVWEDWEVGCFNLVGIVESFDGTQLQLQGWPLLTLGEGVEVDGDLLPGSQVQFQICYDDDMHLVIVYIIILVQVDETPAEPPAGEKVTICHKPNGKNPHSITVDRSALPAHIGHGDYIGQCSGGKLKKK